MSRGFVGNDALDLWLVLLRAWSRKNPGMCG